MEYYTLHVGIHSSITKTPYLIWVFAQTDNTAEINKMLRFFSKRKICYITTDSIRFFYFMALTVPTCSSVNKARNPSGFLLCASSKWWNFKPLPAIFQAVLWLNSLLSTIFCSDGKFIFTRFWLLQVSIAQMSENVQCLSKFI